MSARDALVVFARAPELGRVKTRLAAVMGADAALDVYRFLGARVAAAVAAPDAPWATVVAATPADGHAAVRAWLGDAPRLEPQADGDLGARMRAAVAARLAEGAARVVVVGTDCPDVAAGTVADAFARLAEHDVVFGPALDGGYYLVGVRAAAAPRALPAIFDGVPWSSDRTLAVSLARAGARGLSTALLEPMRDVDTAADWEAWLASRPVPAERAPSAAGRGSPA